MPVYEYRCNSCRRKVNLLQHSPSSPVPSCPHCGSELERLFSTFATHKSYRDAYDDILSDRSLTQGMMRNNPGALIEWNKRMSGGEKPPPEYQEIAERMERGEWPAEQIEQKRREAMGLPHPPGEEED